MIDTQAIRRTALLIAETTPGGQREADELVNLYNQLVVWVRNSAKASLRRRSNKAVTGHVYFIQAAGGGPIKIGFSATPVERMRALRTGAPVRLALLASYPGGYDDERNLHVMFESSRVRGEWFRASPELISAIERVKLGYGLPWTPAAPISQPPTGKPE